MNLMKGFAEGGYISEPTVASFAENEPEYAIPASRMDSAMAQYNSGARGDAVLNSTAPTQPSDDGVSPMGGAVTINYNGPTLKFNSEDYIPRSEAPKLVAEGARMGEARTLGRLRNSPTTRRGVGMR